MTDPIIWYTRWMGDIDTQVIFNYHCPGGFDSELAFSRASRRFQPVDDALAPDFLFFDSHKKIKASCRDAFQIVDAVLVCSPAFRDVLTRFDIGSSRLYEVPIYRDATKKPSDLPPHYVLRVTEAKPGTFVPEESVNIRRPRDPITQELRSPDLPFLAVEDKDQLAVRAEAAQGVDLWYDPAIAERLFLSDRLVQAIEEVGLKSRALRFMRAKIV
ncbi:MAG: hypothetical protein R3D60_10735 [Paracoccaceae bacterium]